MDTSTIKIEKAYVDQLRKIDGSNDSERLCRLLSEYSKKNISEDKVVQILQSYKILLDNIQKSMNTIENLIDSKTGKGY